MGISGGLIVAGSCFGLTGSSVASAATTCGNSTAVICPALSLSDVAPAPGGAETITGTGYASNQTVTLTFNSTPVSLGTVTTDGTGAFTDQVSIPTSAVAGSHTIVGTDASGDTASAALTVTAATSTTGTNTGTVGTGTVSSTGTGSTLPVTGSDTTKGLLIAGDLALLGIPLLVVSRRRLKV